MSNRNLNSAGTRSARTRKFSSRQWLAQTRPEVYHQPHAFDIDRFYEPRCEHRQKFAFTSYGVFPRNCAAMGLVEMMTLCTFSVLLHERHFEQDPHDYELDPGA